METTDAESPGDRPVVTLVQAPACHFCDDAEAALADLARSYPMTVERVDVRSEAGHELVRRHRPALNPLVLVDGAYFSAGRLPRRKLAQLLGQRLVAAETER